MSGRNCTLVAALVAGLAACAGGAATDEPMFQQSLAEEFPATGDIVVVTAGPDLTVKFQNSDMADRSREEITAFTRRVAEFVRDNYDGYARLEAVSVEFESVIGIGPIRKASPRGGFTYFTSTLGQPTTDEPPTDDQPPTTDAPPTGEEDP